MGTDISPDYTVVRPAKRELPGAEGVGVRPGIAFIGPRAVPARSDVGGSNALGIHTRLPFHTRCGRRPSALQGPRDVPARSRLERPHELRIVQRFGQSKLLRTGTVCAPGVVSECIYE